MGLRVLLLVTCTSIACTHVRISDDEGAGGGPSQVEPGPAGGGMAVGGSGGEGGSGGPADLIPAGDIELVPVDFAQQHFNPRFAQLASGEVLLAVTASGLAPDSVQSAAYTVFNPWAAWPPALEVPASLSYGVQDWVTVGALDGHAYLITSTLNGTYLLPNLPDDPDDAVLIAPQADKHIHFAPHSEGSYLLRTEGSNEDVVTTAWPSGASESLAASCWEGDGADAIAIPGGFLVAEQFKTFDGESCPSAPVDLLVTRYTVSEDGGLVRDVVQAIPVGEWGSGRLLERSDGAWLVVWSDDVPGELPFSVRRLDANGLTVSEPIELDAAESPISVGRAGDGFAIAYYEPDSITHLRVRLFGQDGTLRNTSPLVDLPVVGGPAEMLLSPDGSSLLVAVFGYYSDGNKRVALARFDSTSR